MKERILSMLLCISMVIMLFADFIQPIDIDLNIFAWASEGETTDGSGDNTTQDGETDPETPTPDVSDGEEGGSFALPVDCTCGDSYTEESPVHLVGCPRKDCECTEEEYNPDGKTDVEKHTSKFCPLNTNNIPCTDEKCKELNQQHKYICSKAVCDNELCITTTDEESGKEVTTHADNCPHNAFIGNYHCSAGCIVTTGKADSGLYKYPEGKTGKQYMHLYNCEVNCNCGDGFTPPAAEGGEADDGVDDTPMATVKLHKYNCITNCKCYLTKTTISSIVGSHSYYCPLAICSGFSGDGENLTEEEKATSCYADVENNKYVHHRPGCYHYVPSCADGIGNDDHEGCTAEYKINTSTGTLRINITHGTGCPNTYATDANRCDKCGHYTKKGDAVNRHAPTCERYTSTVKSTFSASAEALLGVLDTDNHETDSVEKITDDTTAVTYKLLKDVPLDKTIYIDSGEKVTIDLNGHILSGNGKGSVIINNGDLTVIDSNTETQHKGYLADRAYYYFWSDGTYLRDTRVLEDAVWINDPDYTGADAVIIYGGIITGGVVSIPYEGYAYFGIDQWDKTEAELITALGLTETEYNKMPEYKKTALLASNVKVNSYFNKTIAQHGRSSSLAHGGAGISNLTGATLTMNGGTIAGCQTLATYTGSAVFCDKQSTFTMNGGSIKYNYAMGGGAVSVSGSSMDSDKDTVSPTTFNFKKGIIYENSCVGYGGIISRYYSVVNTGEQNIDDTVTPATEDDTIDAGSEVDILTTHYDVENTPDWKHNNYKTDIESAVTWEYPVIDSNRSVSLTNSEGNGGGIYADLGAVVNMHSGLVHNNWSHYRGGGIDLYGTGHLTMDGDVDIISNYCEMKGGGVSVHYGSDYEDVGGKPSLSFDILSDKVNVEHNMAAFGGGMYMSHLGLKMTGGKINNNKALGYYVGQANAYAPDENGVGNPLTYTVIGYDGELAAVKSNKYYKPDPDASEDAEGTELLWNYSEQKEKYTLVDQVSLTTDTNGGGIYFYGKVNVEIEGGEICYNTVNGCGAGFYLASGSTLKISQKDDNIPTRINGNRIVYQEDAEKYTNDAGFYNEELDKIDRISDEVGSGDGAGIYLGAATIEMSGGEISGNITKAKQHSSAGEGGGISMNNGNFEMTGGKITNNVACERNGGGLHVGSGANTRIEISGENGKKSEVSANTSGYRGGAVAMYDLGTIKISEGAEITDNKSKNEAGAIFLNAGTFEMDGGLISGNEAEKHVGAVYVNMGTFKMTGGTITDNHAYNGNSGGVHVHQNTGVFEMSGGVISYNTSTALAGGVKVNSGIVSLSGDSKIIHNTAGQYGGGLYMEYATANVTIEGNVLIAYNKANEDHGGGIAMRNGGTLTMTGGEIKNNIAHYSGGGIYMGSGGKGTVTINDGKITGNFAVTNFGGGIYMDGNKNESTFTMTGGEITDNHSSKNGGGIAIGQSNDAARKATFTMTDGEIDNNTAGIAKQLKDEEDNVIAATTAGADDCHGGGVSISAEGSASNDKLKFIMSGGSISNNESGKNGGAVHVYRGTVQISGNTLIDKNISGKRGGGVHVYYGTITVENGTLSNNKAENHGGGVYVDNGDYTMTGGSITNNAAIKNDGGGVYVYKGNFTMNGGSITYNKALADNVNKTANDNNVGDAALRIGCGGAIAVHGGDSTITITEGDITNNEARYRGGAIFLNGTNTTLTLGSVDNKAQNGATEFAVNITNNKKTEINKDTYQSNEYGGGAIYTRNADVTVYNADISYNTVTDSNTSTGGAMHITGGDFTVYGGRISNNQCTNHWAGAVYMNGGDLIMYSGEFYSNYSGDNGGFAYIGGSGNVYLYDGVKMYNNEAKYYVGGAFCVAAGDVYMYGGEVTGNKVTNTSDIEKYHRGYGGAFALHGSNPKFVMYDGKISENTATQGGGAIVFTSGGTCYIYGGEISNNSVTGDNKDWNKGGAVFMTSGTLNVGRQDCTGQTTGHTHQGKEDPDTPTEVDCNCDKDHPVITGNSAEHGGAFAIAQGTVNLYCGSINDNTANQKGGGIYVADVDFSDSTTLGEGSVTINIKNAYVIDNKVSTNDATDGVNLYMDKKSGTLTYTNDNTFDQTAAPGNPGVIVVSGKFLHTGSDDLVSVYLQNKGTGERIEIQLPEGQFINLPDATKMWPDYEGKNNVTFLGWQHPYEGSCVYAPDEYKPMGTAVQVIRDKINGVEQDTMTLHAVWAPKTNYIKYYFSQTLRNKDNTGENTGENAETPNVTKTYTYGQNVNVPGNPEIPTELTKAAPGYTFAGWILFQNKFVDGNWNLPETGQMKNPSATAFKEKYYWNGDSIPSVYIGKDYLGNEYEIQRFGELQYAANWMTEIEYKVAGNIEGCTVNVNGQSGITKETVYITSTSDAVGAIPTASADYIFVGWYIDDKCTKPVTAANGVINNADGSIDPVYNPETGFYDVLTYYAKFEPRYTELTINTTGTDADQSFVFVVEEAGLTYANALYGQENATFEKMEVVFAANESGNGTITIKHVPVGSYKVYEKNTTKANVEQQDTWTWRYGNTDVVKQDAAKLFEFKYENKPKFIFWLSFYTKKFFGIIN